MTTTTIKVPVALRDRLAERAKREHTTMAGIIARSMDAADTEAFWAEFRATMGADSARAELEQQTAQMSGTLKDGLEPEDWSDIL